MIQLNCDAIQVWRFDKAPDKYKQVATKTEYDEDWLLFAPNNISQIDVQEVIEGIRDYSQVSTHAMADGIIYITYH